MPEIMSSGECDASKGGGGEAEGAVAGTVNAEGFELHPKEGHLGGHWGCLSNMLKLVF